MPLKGPRPSRPGGLVTDSFVSPTPIRCNLHRFQQLTRRPKQDLTWVLGKACIVDVLAKATGAVGEMVIGLAQGLQAIGTATLAGRQIAERRHFLKGFFRTLHSGLSNPNISPAAARRGTIRPRQVRLLELTARHPDTPPHHRQANRGLVAAYDAGTQAAQSFLAEIPCERTTLRRQLEATWGLQWASRLERIGLENAR